MKTLQDYLDKLNILNFKEMYNGNFFLTWEKTDDELSLIHIFTHIVYMDDLPFVHTRHVNGYICPVWTDIHAVFAYGRAA